MTPGSVGDSFTDETKAAPQGPCCPQIHNPYNGAECSGNAQCLTVDTNCWLTNSSALIYNLKPKVLQWPLCVCTLKLNMTTGQWEQIRASTIVVVLACIQAHHARMDNILLMNIKNYTNVTALLRMSFARQKLVQQDSIFYERDICKSHWNSICLWKQIQFWRGGLTRSRFSSFVTKGLVKADSLLTCLFDDQHSRTFLLILLNYQCRTSPEWKHQKPNEMTVFRPFNFYVH